MGERKEKAAGGGEQGGWRQSPEFLLLLNTPTLKAARQPPPPRGLSSANEKARSAYITTIMISPLHFPCPPLYHSRSRHIFSINPFSPTSSPTRARPVKAVLSLHPPPTQSQPWSTMSSTNQNRKKKKNGKITAAEKQHSLQVKALHISFCVQHLLLQGHGTPPLSEILCRVARRGGREEGREEI